MKTVRTNMINSELTTLLPILYSWLLQTMVIY